MTIGAHTLILGVADPQRKFEGVLRAFTTVLLLSTPVILALATVCGLWLGRRALAPVARITDDARAITESNLSARLAVPDSRDELQQLSETLNDMLERIEQSFTRTRQFTADASHELRAPMTLIYTAAQYSLRRERSREELVDSMQKILRESQRTTALIDDLLLLARGDAGRETASLEAIDAAPLLRDAAEQATAMAAAKDIRVSLQLETERAARPGERGAAAAAAADPGRQRAQVHAVRRPRDDRRQRRRDGGDALRGRHRRRHLARRSAARVRALLAGRQGAVAGGRRHRARPDHREADRGGARSPSQRPERGRPRLRLHRPAADAASRRRGPR